MVYPGDDPIILRRSGSSSVPGVARITDRVEVLLVAAGVVRSLSTDGEVAER
jgi:hypothetical protein